MAKNATRSQLTNPNGTESSIDITGSDSTGKIHSGALNITSVPKAKDTGGFYIMPIVSGTMRVQLSNQEDGEYFDLQSATLDAYLGTWIPMKVKKVISVTTATYQIGW